MRGCRTALTAGCLVALAWGSACSGSDSNLGAGEACVRTSQCGDGLACVAGRCASDVGELGENGTVPDAGADVDGEVVVPDGGELDAGAPMDAGRVDSGPVEMDAGPPDTDAGPPDTDAGPPEMDAGPPETDAGADPDAGSAADGG